MTPRKFIKDYATGYILAVHRNALNGTTGMELLTFRNKEFTSEKLVGTEFVKVTNDKTKQVINGDIIGMEKLYHKDDNVIYLRRYRGGYRLHEAIEDANNYVDIQGLKS
jgi:hypothetical protein